LWEWEITSFQEATQTPAGLVPRTVRLIERVLLTVRRRLAEKVSEGVTIFSGRQQGCRRA
jgi:hypothetical protein